MWFAIFISAVLLISKGNAVCQGYFTFDIQSAQITQEIDGVVVNQLFLGPQAGPILKTINTPIIQSGLYTCRAKFEKGGVIYQDHDSIDIDSLYLPIITK